MFSLSVVGLSEALAATLLAGLGTVVFQYARTWYRLSSIPVTGLDIGSEEKRRLAYLAQAKSLYQAGYQKFKHGLFRITTARNAHIVVVHPQFLAELNKLPDSILSVEDAVNESMESIYTKLSTIPMIPHAIKTMLTPGLNRLAPLVAQEIQQSLKVELPECADWTPVAIHSKLLRIVATASGRIFVGPKVCRDDKYLSASIDFTNEVMEALGAVQAVKHWLRPFLASRLPAVQKLNHRRKTAQELLQPIIHERRDNNGTSDENSKHDDMLQWLMDTQPNASDAMLTEQQLGVSFAAIHTTTLTATNALYNLAAMPEIAEELRKEARDILNRHDGAYSFKALQEMVKLDSFLKETLRCHPFTFSAYQRKVLKSFRLSSGQVIPAGVTIECASHAVSLDDENFVQADSFDALRFYKMRQQATGSDAAHQNQFVSLSQTCLAFGSGRHACPGRFFAGSELKLIVAALLLEFDMKNTEGEEGRYPNIEFAQMCIPDPTRSVQMKKISSQ